MAIDLPLTNANRAQIAVTCIALASCAQYKLQDADPLDEFYEAIVRAHGDPRTSQTKPAFWLCCHGNFEKPHVSVPWRKADLAVARVPTRHA